MHALGELVHPWMAENNVCFISCSALIMERPVRCTDDCTARAVMVERHASMINGSALNATYA